MSQYESMPQRPDVVIQGVTKQTISMKVDGKEIVIPNNKSELLDLLAGQQAEHLQVGEKIYNIGEIGNAEFSTIINQYYKESRKSYLLRLFSFVIFPLLVVALAYTYYHYQILQHPLFFTVRLKTSNGVSDSALRNALINLRYGEKSERATVSSNEAIFKGIPANFKNKMVAVDFAAEGFVPIDTAFVLANNTIELHPQRNNAYARIFGLTRADGTGEMLDSVLISVGELMTWSDAQGRFTIQIPPEKQRRSQRIHAVKTGYKNWDRTEPVIEDEEIVIVLKREAKNHAP